MWKHKRPWIASEVLSKEDNDRGATIPGFKLFSRAIVTRQDGAGTKIGQLNNMKVTDTNSHSYSHLILDRDVKTKPNKQHIGDK